MRPGPPLTPAGAGDAVPGPTPLFPGSVPRSCACLLKPSRFRFLGPPRKLALAPYLYTAARAAHDGGVAAVHSLYIDSPEAPAAYASNASFMHGDALLVRPSELAGS